MRLIGLRRLDAWLNAQAYYGQSTTAFGSWLDKWLTDPEQTGHARLRRLDRKLDLILPHDHLLLRHQFVVEKENELPYRPSRHFKAMKSQAQPSRRYLDFGDGRRFGSAKIPAGKSLDGIKAGNGAGTIRLSEVHRIRARSLNLVRRQPQNLPEPPFVDERLLVSIEPAR